MRLIAIHGMWTNLHIWSDVQERFRKSGIELETLTLPRQHLGRSSISEYTVAAHRFLKTSSKPAVLIGWSLGGLIAQQLASQEPDQVKGLLLLAPVPPPPIRILTCRLIRKTPDYWCRFAFWRKPYKPSFRKAQQLFLHELPPAVQKAEWEAMVPESGRAIAEVLFQAKAIKVETNKITCPTRIISGKRDQVIRPQQIKQMKSLYPLADITLGHWGHWLPKEAAEHITSQCCSWCYSQNLL